MRDPVDWALLFLRVSGSLLLLLLIIFTTLAISGPGALALGRRVAGPRARALWLHRGVDHHRTF